MGFSFRRFSLIASAALLAVPLFTTPVASASAGSLTQVVVQCTTDCYVDGANGLDSNGGASPADAKQHIQSGIDQVSSGGTVHVGDGTYDENLVIRKPLTLEGNQHGVLAKGRSGAQTVVRALNSSNPVDVRADNVTIDGFVFDGGRATSQPWIITALSGPGDGRYQDVTVENNEFLGNPGDGTFPGGLYLSNHDDLRVEGNFFNALGQHAVFLAGTSNGAVYSNNDSYRNYNSNISTQDQGEGHTGLLVENNRVVEDDMILFNTHDATVRNNTITGGSYAPSRIFLGGGNTATTISGNRFSALKTTAVQVFDPGFGYGANSDVSVTDNTIDTTVANQVDNYSLIDLRDVHGTNLVDGNKVTLSGTYAAGGAATNAVGVRGSGTEAVTISDNELDGGGVSSSGTPASSGVLIRSNSANGALPSDAEISISGNRLENFTNGVAVYDFVARAYGSLRTGVDLAVRGNSITGNSANGVITAADDPMLDAERNWWGDPSGPQPTGTGDRAIGNVDYDPWLCSGQDTSPDVGFQPGPQTSPCVGTLQVVKYDDQNRNRARDNGEPGLSDWTMTVTQGTTTVASGTTTSDGITFSNLAPGSYTVCETSQSGWQNTDPSDGSGCKTAVVTVNGTTTVLLGNATVATGPAPAQSGKIYAVNTTPGSVSQLFTVDVAGAGTVAALGSVYRGYDLESVDIDPVTKAIYASSGSRNRTGQRGWLWQVDGLTGELTPIGSSRQGSLTALTFRADGALWGWAAGKGLVSVDKSTGAATVVFASTRSINGLAFNSDGSKLYAAAATKLYEYDVSSGTLVQVAKNLPGGTKALDLRPDGTLVVGVRNSTTIFVYDPVTRKVTSEQIVVAPYDHVEGIGYPVS